MNVIESGCKYRLYLAGPKVLTLAVEEAREEKAEEEDGQLPALPRDDPHRRQLPRHQRRGGRERFRSHDEEIYGSDRKLSHLRTTEP